jgi:hypothetical protein
MLLRDELITVIHLVFMPDTSRPNVLYLVHRVPYPPDKGDRIRNFHILTSLARHASVHLACLADESVDHAAVKSLEKLVDRVAVVRLRAGQRGAGGCLVIAERFQISR